jgi:hypothetical protein
MHNETRDVSSHLNVIFKMPEENLFFCDKMLSPMTREDVADNYVFFSLKLRSRTCTSLLIKSPPEQNDCDGCITLPAYWEGEQFFCRHLQLNLSLSVEIHTHVTASCTMW